MRILIYQLGQLEYKSLRFETEERLEEENHQGVAVVNYTERTVPLPSSSSTNILSLAQQPVT